MKIRLKTGEKAGQVIEVEDGAVVRAWVASGRVELVDEPRVEAEKPETPERLTSRGGRRRVAEKPETR